MQKYNTADVVIASDHNADEPKCPHRRPTEYTLPHASLLNRALTLTAEQIAQTSLEEARSFYRQLAREIHLEPETCRTRLSEIEESFANTGAYIKSPIELEFAAKIAWRNNIRCIGRQHWRSLKVRDLRHVQKASDLFEAAISHLQEATNGGSIVPLMSVFSRANANRSGPRILNHQLIRYAGYRSQSGEIMGDPQSEALTKQALDLGWCPPGPPTPFDVLPLLIAERDGSIRVYELPRKPEIVLEVPILHPKFRWFKRLGLRWYAVPAICNMALDAGGLKYPAVTFNGWYMGTEIASRNLGDVERYNVLPKIGALMGLETANDRSLWKDRALVELNAAVLYSFERAGVRITDHHSASKQFSGFEHREAREGRRVCGDWAWLVPPLSGSACPMFHRGYSEDVEKPGLFYHS